MKKLITFFILSAFYAPLLHAQTTSDALRYADQDIEGSARFRGMSGAFGALGGDLSALQVNPAGSAVFKNSFGSITLSNANVSNDATYFGRSRNTTENNLNFNQLGAVFVFENLDDNIPINKLTFGLNYDQTRNNDDSFFAIGRSSNSIDSHFIDAAQGIPLDRLTLRSGESINQLYGFLGENGGVREQDAFLAFESFIINPDDPDDLDNTTYTSAVAAGDFDQEYTFESTGFNGKFSVNGALQFQEDFYLGINLNSHFINYDQVTEYFEGNNNTGSDINEIIFTNRLSTIGTGFSAHIGGIAKVSSFLRLGASIETPTWFLISEETTQRLETISDVNGRALVNPNVINVFPDYRLRTPAKFTGSMAFIFGKRGLISFDYSYKDYTTTKFSSSENVSFSNQNNTIKNTLQAASSLRVGGELRHKNWRFRGGFRYDESPYKNEITVGETTGFSLGTGYNFGKIKLDIAYDRAEQDRNQQFIDSDVFTNGASISRETENITVTFSLNL